VIAAGNASQFSDGRRGVVMSLQRGAQA